MMPTFEVQMKCNRCGSIRPAKHTGKQCLQCGGVYVLTSVVQKPTVACEMSAFCPDAGAKCFVAEEVPLKDGVPVKDWSTLPSKRWLYCYSYKRTLGLTFIPELGIYHLPRCPLCNLNLVAELKKNLEEAKQ